MRIRILTEEQRNTRTAYGAAVSRLLAWCETHGLALEAVFSRRSVRDYATMGRRSWFL